MKYFVIVLLVLVGCTGEHRDARDLFNQGVAALAKADYEQAEKLLLEARSTSGVDPELRFRAAYDLGLAYAAHADKVKQGEEPDLQKALELAQQAASWLSDAARLRKGDPAVEANLAIVRARVQAISDELRAAEGKLEARLDKLIAEQREVLDDARGAWIAIKQTGGADPLAQQAALTRLADRERGIVADTGVVADLAADEIDAIGKKAEDKRSEEEKVRVVQLKNLDLYLLDARNRIADARRKLQELAAEDGVSKAEAALVALKRGREQLLDPITVLRAVAQDEVGVLRETMLAAASDGSLKLDQQLPPPEQMPAWLAPTAIGERQSGLRDRLEEVRGRFTAAASAPATPPDPNADPKAQQQAAEQAKLLERVKLALPAVIEASTAMERAQTMLQGGKAKAATVDERAALTALGKAIEQFADLKHLVELAYQDQAQLVKLLGPEMAKQLPADERANETAGALDRNLARMPRLQELLVEQVAQADAQAKQPPPQASDPKAAEQAAAAQKEQIEQMKQMLTRAEQLRGEAAVSLATLQKAIASNADPLTPAKDAETKLVELRKLFFSVIEHLQQLIRDQGDTRDKTSATNTEDMFGREAKLPPLVTTQTQHGELAKAITDALAAQADAAGKQKAPPQPGQPDAKAFSGAAAEVRLAQSDMGDAVRDLTKARDDKAASHSLDPVTKAQGTAIEHLEAALKLLQPPQKQQNKDDKQDQQKQDQQEKQDQQKQDQQQQQSGGASQRARDEDAKRQKQRAMGGDPDGDPQQRKDMQSAPVEKDW